ncbi:TonB-dependent receptor plug domain-containing protein [Sphingopyxis sp.]|uniref:TonB-dependent receptor plug domain-containing protein n=1 Tax=Sphingopyxis sp. TaxID=1908224 RepID=UPI002ED8D168
MHKDIYKLGYTLARGSSAAALAIGLCVAVPAAAQTASEAVAANDEEILVTGSRIARAGFDQPTPTTVIGEDELRLGARPNIQQVLNDLPQIRPTTTPSVSNGNTSTGTAPVDMRGLGTDRTLVLLDGRRFVGGGNLNFIPTNLVERVEVVTGGASAAWGSGAVAGVVNILLDKDYDGLSIGGNVGISSRGDGFRYGFDAKFGTSFADGRGHFIIGGEYVKDRGVINRSSRPQLNSPDFIPSGTGSELVRDVNFGNVTLGGLITSGVLAGQTFNPDGSLRDFRRGTGIGAGAFPLRMVGGEDGINLYDTIPVSSPFERLSTYARLSYEVGDATFWVDGTYARALSNAPFFGDYTVGGALGLPYLTIQADNPYLSQGIRDQLAAAGETSFTLGRYFNDALQLQFRGLRVSKEAAIGVDGTFGNGFRYKAWYSHGEVDSEQSMANSRLVRQFNNAINAVSSGGQAVCAINADADPANDDPACRPINPFGAYNISPEARDYITGTQQSFGTTKLDSAGAEVQGDLFSLWAGPVTFAVGAEARWEEQISSRDDFTVANASNFGILVFSTPTSGGFSVKEGFGEILMPVLKLEDKLELDFNGAARYSDYSTSGGIWTWKLGGTARLFGDLLLRATRSRDIRSPGIGELFAVRSINIGPLNDQDNPAARLAANPAYNPTPSTVTTFTGGNPDLVPEVSYTTALGATYSPSYIPGFSASVDYYKIKIDGAITALNGSNLTLACFRGSTAACDRITRDSTGTVVEVAANQQNIASFETSGFDMEASYVARLAEGGSIRLRALATYVDKLVFDTGLSRVETAGDVGDSVLRATPKWRGTLSATYEDDNVGFDIRARYIGGGNYDRTRTTLINNKIGARTYVDIGARFKVDDRFTMFANVNNVFDRKPPLITVNSTLYDVVGTYATVGARVDF